MFSNVFRKSCRLLDNVEKYGTVRQATNDNIIRRMRISCWMTNATDKHSEYVILFVFYIYNDYTHVPQYYVYNTLTNFLILSFRRVLYVICFLLGNSPSSES